MKAHILSTGDELILGQISDTNAAFLARELRDMGILLEQIHTVGDDLVRLIAVIREISGEADLVLVTGGLGPTTDDLTAMAAAGACNDILQINEAALSSMKHYFKKRGFVLTKGNEKQALLPSTATVLVNEHGTAPGFCIRLQKCVFFFMPGVPSEMEQMFYRQVRPAIEKQLNITDRIMVETLSVFGLAESRVSDLLAGFELKFTGMRLGFRAMFPTIQVKIMYHDTKVLCPAPYTSAADWMQAAKAWVISKLENRVYSDRGLSLAEELGRVLTEKHMTLAIAESCTGGLISDMITDVPGSSGYFLLSAVTYANEAKENILGVKKDTLIRHGAVHEQTALEMVLGIQAKAGAHVAVSTTGIAGPDGGSDEKPVGTVCIGVAGPGFAESKRYKFSFGDRHKNKQMFAATAVHLLLKMLKPVDRNQSMT